MIRMMQTKTPGVVGFRVLGTVDDEDVSQVARAIDTARERNDKISIVADLTEFEDMTLKGLVADVREGVRRVGTLPDLERVAVIAPEGWLHKATRAEDLVLPGVDVKGFLPQNADAARAWAAQGHRA